MRALALSAALAVVCAAPPAIAASFDGNWSMLVVTTNGHCGKVNVGMGISHGRIYATRGKFAAHRIQLAGRVSTSGYAKINAVAGPRKAQGIGQFRGSKASGKWNGTGPSGVCSGIWTAVRAARGT
jgi:hypothetical protein